MSAASPRRAFVLVGTTLGVIYLASLAPGVTFWDAGEFASAVESFGIPHPPGTPLFILVARAWRLLLDFLPTAIGRTDRVQAYLEKHPKFRLAKPYSV